VLGWRDTFVDLIGSFVDRDNLRVRRYELELREENRKGWSQVPTSVALLGVRAMLYAPRDRPNTTRDAQRLARSFAPLAAVIAFGLVIALMLGAAYDAASRVKSGLETQDVPLLGPVASLHIGAELASVHVVGQAQLPAVSSASCVLFLAESGG